MHSSALQSRPKRAVAKASIQPRQNDDAVHGEKLHLLFLCLRVALWQTFAFSTNIFRLLILVHINVQFDFLLGLHWCTGSASWTAEVAWRRRNSIRRFDVHPVIRTEHYHMGLCEQYQNGSSIHTHVMKCGACAVVWPVALCRLSIGTACFGRSSHGNSFPSHIQSMIDFACIGMEIWAVFFSISLFVCVGFLLLSLFSVFACRWFR